MGKNKQTKPNESAKKTGKASEHPRDTRNRRDGKPRNPKQVDHLQQIPFRLREIMKSQERMKMGASRTRQSKTATAARAKPGDSEVGDIPVPYFRRAKEESEKNYLRRMAKETNHVRFLTRNQVDRKPELEEEKQEKPAYKGKTVKKKAYDQVRLQRLQHKKHERQAQELEKEMFTDNVEFGDVAMAPPALSAKPKKAPIKSQNTTRELLLNSLLGQAVASTAKPSMARQRIVEMERERAVEAYRHLKKQKQQWREARAAGLEKLKNL
ncbi:coiled-coil domain-containing protein 137 [Lampris incognitus]|uniref:coiled-coil domain-containing protein 137 n=1 Tax=Lampris incognitus TaxID=2546036 RepID=UPI0024B5DD09|nr:coiled-coil domain-containing protein 137 [Lampris incognitus]